jgi:hypothetical protein
MNIINDYFKKNEKIIYPFQRIKFRRKTKSVKDIIKKNFNILEQYTKALSNFHQKNEKKKLLFNDNSFIKDKKNSNFPNIFKNKISLNKKLNNSLSFNYYGYEYLQNLSVKNISIPLFSSIIKKKNVQEKEKNIDFLENKFTILKIKKKNSFNLNNKSSDFIINKSCNKIKSNILN